MRNTSGEETIGGRTRSTALTKEQILEVLEANDGLCMDNDEERELLAEALMEALSENDD